jgi:TonB family protein
MAAPPTVDMPNMDFGDGAHAVVAVSDPKLLYKGLVESALRSHWARRDDIADETYAAEVELAIDTQGTVRSSRWIRGSGDERWDKTVKAAVEATKAISRPPPKGFPERFITRFDVEAFKTEEVFNVSSR